LERFGTDLARINIWLLFLFVTRIMAGARSRNLFSGAEESSAHRREHFGIQNPNGKNRNRCIIDMVHRLYTSKAPPKKGATKHYARANIGESFSCLSVF